jgi:hypothetical protein
MVFWRLFAMRDIIQPPAHAADALECKEGYVAAFGTYDRLEVRCLIIAVGVVSC